MGTLPKHSISAADKDFKNRFEDWELPLEEFNHYAHVRLAYICLCTNESRAAINKMKGILKAFLAFHEVDPSKYHETMTCAWIRAVRYFMLNCKHPRSSAKTFIAANPELLNFKIMLTHYSASTLFSEQARSSYVQPDLTPIPV